MSKKILLLGAGFIGTNFYNLFKDKYDISVMDIGDYPCTLVNGLWDMGKINWHKGDIADYNELEKAVADVKPDYIVNMAANSHVDVSVHGKNTFIRSNVAGVENVLKILKQEPKIRLVHFSTDEVYGDVPLESDYEFSETDLLTPSSPYSASKASADMFIKAYGRTYGTDVVSVRPSNNYGPYQYPEKLIPFLIKRLSEGKKLPIYGTGQNVREWLFVEDCCRGVELVMNKGIKGEVYNIGSGIRKNNIFIAEQLAGGQDNMEYVSDRPGHDMKYAINSAKIHSLGWKPEVNIEDGLARTKEWYLKRIDLINKLQSNPHIK